MKVMHSGLTLGAVTLTLAISWGAYGQQLRESADAAGTAGAARQSALSDGQVTEASARIEVAKSLAARVEADAAALRLGEGWKVELMQRLLSVPSSQLKAIAAASTGSYSQVMDAANAALTAARSGAQQKALGANNQDLVFYPITPCRNADTRNAGGKITGGTFRDFDADLGSSQGGSAGCYTVPARDAAA